MALAARFLPLCAFCVRIKPSLALREINGMDVSILSPIMAALAVAASWYIA